MINIVYNKGDVCSVKLQGAIMKNGGGNETFNKLCQQLNARAKLPGVTQVDILNLPPPLDNLLRKIIRQGSITVGEFTQDLHLAKGQGERLVKILIDKGYLYTESSGRQTICKIHFARKEKKRLPTDIWNSLDF